MQSNQYVIAPKNVINTTTERLSIINYFIVLNFQDVGL